MYLLVPKCPRGKGGGPRQEGALRASRRAVTALA